MCNGDTFWIEGDGVPDFKADIPPPSPEVRVIPSEGKLTVRWNGIYSENVVDPFTRTKDFEGYRVYAGLDDRATSLSVLSSFDNLNFNMYKLIKKTNDLFVWENQDLPLTLDSLKIRFNDPNFDPLNWTRNNPLNLNDTLYRFEKQDFNQFDLTTKSGIHKVFPNAIDPGPDTLLWNDSDLVFDWERPLPKFYEYEFEIEDVLPTVRQFVSVTAFDFGFPAGNIPPRESNKLNSITESFPQNNVDSVEQYNLDVYIYPNPYRIDENYIQRGFENRDGTQADQRAHRVHFVNLPRVCKITIYSLDGDRIDSFDHNFPQGGPEAMHDEWDMITRNSLIPVSGIYYWVVEAATRTQMGKLIIIK